MQSYTQAHAQHKDPPDILGGPLTVTVTQKSGPTTWALPGPRWLDPAVFGTPTHPAGFDPAPDFLLGVPIQKRIAEDGRFLITDGVTPFSDWAESGTGSVEMTVVDETAIDGATTKDTIDFTATFTGPGGGAYKVTCDKPLPHGLAYPSFGGVFTNGLMHGNAGVGTRLMPTEYCYVAFWGIGDVYKNDKQIGTNRIVHVMVTEQVRGDGYRLDFDHDVGSSPRAKMFHLVVPPFKPDGKGGLEYAPLRTGFNPLPDVEEHFKAALKQAKATPEKDRTERQDLKALKQVKDVLDKAKEQMQQATKAGKMDGQPFLHVMFSNFKIEAKHS